ncbi:hypothetical protein ZIOFF_016881 [Zingiber officinale]|uniref:Endoplasmic reticulum-Golgi intermediate compartment protein 3 n=1 Tax=Zingiber officinale TaxID=94328 RepID=A0A8J5LHV9_ZINOF|nr:hypothetical protein ZIOFF_016881 [Zingiber officinale]
MDCVPEQDLVLATTVVEELVPKEMESSPLPNVPDHLSQSVMVSPLLSENSVVSLSNSSDTQVDVRKVAAHQEKIDSSEATSVTLGMEDTNTIISDSTFIPHLIPRPVVKEYEAELPPSLTLTSAHVETRQNGRHLRCYFFARRSKMGRFQSLRNFDAFPRAEEHLLQKTHSGAIVSIIGIAVMVTLFVHELQYYLTTYTVHQMSVDVKRGENLPIHINITFPSLPCEVLSVDAIDMSGKHEVDLDTNIWKLRLTSDGKIMGAEYLSDLVEKEHSGHKHVAKLNIFRILRDPYLHEHLVYRKLSTDESDHHDESSQHKHEHTLGSDAEKMIENVKQAISNGEGCRVYGVLDVQRVAGNFHISVHGLNIFVAQQVS